MQIPFTKMHGAGNDFVVIDETQRRYGLLAADYRFLADRHFGVGADQILTVRPSPEPGVDFEYLIHNADGGEVEQCGNGARCFARFVRDAGLTTRDTIRVRTRSGVIEPALQPDGRVKVNMGLPIFDTGRVPYELPGDLWPQPDALYQKVPLPGVISSSGDMIYVAVASMGNPHAVLWVDDVEAADVAGLGAAIETHPCFPNRTNVGFAQVIDPGRIALRVFERGVGETLACGTGACAAVALGVISGRLREPVAVQMRGGLLTIEWDGDPNHPVWMTGPAVTVFKGSIHLPPHPDAPPPPAV